ncbi:MAG TPA: ATP-binding protein [Polyangiaceae bacterium]|nr:ATP-binding protein [Polyangiaceae bacterium]
MSASAMIVQLVRAHYTGNNAAFSSAALALARSAKTPAIRQSILGFVHGGATNGQAPRPLQQLRPPPSRPVESNDLLRPLDPVTFADLLLEDAQQKQLDEICVELEYRTELAERKLRARNRLLFWGPPGNGKSSSAVAIANALGVQAYGVSIPDLMSKWVNETGQNLGRLFQSIGPDTVVVFDEIDAIGASRSAGDSGAGHEANKVVNTLLTLLDRCKDGVIVGTTNRPDILDPALRRRFDEHIEFPEPSVAQMTSLAKRLCEHYAVPLCDIRECRNFDTVTKTVEREARRIVMAELLAADEADEETQEK